MRVAIISDIHGNYTAFQAVLADIKKQNIDQFICLGDTVTLGPQPVEVLNALRELNCTYIRGNHDAAVLAPEQAEKFEIADILIPDLHWCKDRLSQADLDLIASFKEQHELVLPNGEIILLFHGSPLSFTDIIQATTDPALLDKYFAAEKASVFIGGHSHVQMYRRHGDKLILNSGSVGNAFRFTYIRGKPPVLLPWAEYLVIGQEGNSLNVDLRRVYFDTNELLRLVAESSMPGKSRWQNKYQPNE